MEQPHHATSPNTAANRHSVAEIRRLWKQTGGENLVPTSSQNEELQAYYNATVLNLLCQLEELQESSMSDSAMSFVRKFGAAHDMMFQQLRLLTNIGTVLLPLPEALAQ